MNNIDLVIAYYKEDLDWLEDYKNINFKNIYIYNKGPQEIPNINRSFIEIKLPNVGREGHTYLYHIITNYNNLSNITIFTTGSVSIPKKTQQLKIIINKTIETSNTVFWAPYIDTNIRDAHYNFTLEEYNSTHINNIHSNNKLLLLSDIRPFGVWYDTFFQNVIINRINYLGIFSVSKQHILQHELSYYIKLINQFPNHFNPEVGHYFERSWIAIFHPIPEICIFPQIEKFNKFINYYSNIYYIYA